MSEAISHRNHYPGPLNPPARQALRLWLACHRLGGIMEDLSDQAPPACSFERPETTDRPWPIPPMPIDQLDFQEWIRVAVASIFGYDGLPDWPIVTSDAPKVEGLIIYAALCGTFKFYAAWVESTGTFIGWLKIQPAVEGVDSDFGIGEVFGKWLDSKISMDLNGHLAVDRFVRELQMVVWAIGVVED
jgi:hypothetical protein